MRQAFRDAFLAFRRAPLLSALGIATISFSLFSLGLFGLVALNLRDALQSVEERVEIRGFLADSADTAQVRLAADSLRRLPEIASVTFVSRDEALARAKRELGEFRDVFDAAVLPASLDVRLRPGNRDPQTVAGVAARVRAMEVVDDVRWGADWIRKLHRIRSVAAATGAVLGAAFAIAALIIVSATIRLTVLSRSREIQIMRLVGATDGYIRLPFLLDGAVKGLAGGLLALLLTWLAHGLVSQLVVRTAFFSPLVATLGVLGGAVLGLLGAALSVGRQLQRVGHDRRQWK